MSVPRIDGFLPAQKITAAGGTYRGRFACQRVQWTGDGRDAIATFTTSAGELTDAAESQLIWTDQDVQRGVQPGLKTSPPRELPIGAGFPDPKTYVFDSLKADDMAEKLLRGDKLFLNPLVWNLRPSAFEAFWSQPTDEVFLYSGRIYLPDSHHRHQAIVKAVRLWREKRTSYPTFNESRQFKVELYFLNKEDEGNYFFDKNQLPKPVAQSKAYDLTNQDDLSVLAKALLEASPALRNNVNRVTDRLSARNPQVVTLSTLREMMRTYAGADSIDEAELEGLATSGARFYDLLVSVRPELGQLELKERNLARRGLIVDSATMMHGYAALMRDFKDSLADGSVKAFDSWRKRLKRLGPGTHFTYKKWSGDLFSRDNPLWRGIGILKPGTGGGLNILNTGGARAACARVLRWAMSDEFDPARIVHLVEPT
jgi:hypothetical protein